MTHTPTTIALLTLSTMLACATVITNDHDTSDSQTSLPPTSVGETTDEPDSDGEESTSSTTGEPPATSTTESADGTTTDEPPETTTGVPECPGTKLEHEACGTGCGDDCIAGLECRPNYPGGALAECAKECESAGDCTSQVCSGGYCIIPCDQEGGCPDGLFCYPPVNSEGAPILDEAHPDRHCMPMAL